MPAKLRVSKMRNALITPEAVALFRRGCEIIAAGDHECDEEDGGCQAEYLEISKRLDWQLLGLAGDCGTLDIEAGHDADVPAVVEQDGTYRASIPRARELHALLKKGTRR